MSKIHTLLTALSTPKQNDRVNIVATKNNFLTPEECARAIKLGQTQDMVKGSLGSDDNILEKTRRSSVTYLIQNKETSWLYQKFHQEVETVNKDAYQYDIAGLEVIQLAVYEVNDHYDWHTDLGMGDNSTRKLSLSVQLSNPEDYDGGELEFMKTTHSGSKQQGTIIIFPSFLHHRVTPITKGKRYSLVAWVHGNAFR